MKTNKMTPRAVAVEDVESGAVLCKFRSWSGSAKLASLLMATLAPTRFGKAEAV